MLSEKHKENLQTFKKWLLDNHTLVQDNLSMTSFVWNGCNPEYAFDITKEVIEDRQNSECKTTCCLLGWASASGLFKDQIEGLHFGDDAAGWSRFSNKIFGLSQCHKKLEIQNAWYFLFSANNPDNLDDCIERIDNVLNYFEQL